MGICIKLFAGPGDAVEQKLALGLVDFHQAESLELHPAKTLRPDDQPLSRLQLWQTLQAQIPGGGGSRQAMTP
jgi:hypothetical protein